MTDVVLFDEIPAGAERRFGVATLNAPSTLNALSLEMVRALGPALRRWESDDGIAGVVLQGAGEKAFCAGGDLHELYRSMREEADLPDAYFRRFFAEEYTLDYRIHAYGKPVMCWGDGIVMGGGLGLMAGASHRVVTPKSRIAMPENGIGFFPDVGGSWILRRMPGRVGLFLALTGAPLNAADAIFCGLGDVPLRVDAREKVLADIAAEAWSAEPRDNRATLSRLLGRHRIDAIAESNVRRHFDVINSVMAGDDLGEIARRLRHLDSDDIWLTKARDSFRKGSPSSSALSFELWQRVKLLSLADVFRLEYAVAVACSTRGDFAEGIRALLVDKDRQPRWALATVEDASPAWVDAHFALAADEPRVLADLHAALDSRTVGN